MPAQAPVPQAKSPSEKIIPRILPSEPPQPPPPPAPVHEIKLPPPPVKLQRPEVKAPPPLHHPSAAASKAAAGKAKIEFLPWSQLSGGQKLARFGMIAFGLLLVFVLFRGILSMLHPATGPGAAAPAAQSQPEQAAMTPGDRKDGIESLCKVFNIYGMPKTDSDAADDAKNAGELFKLAGNQSPERSAYILSTLAKEFRAGHLTTTDCSAAGTPLDTSDANIPFGGSAAAQPGHSSP